MVLPCETDLFWKLDPVLTLCESCSNMLGGVGCLVSFFGREEVKQMWTQEEGLGTSRLV